MRILLFWSVLIGTLVTTLLVTPIAVADAGQSSAAKTQGNPPLPMTRLASFDGWQDYAVVGDFVYASQSQRLAILGFTTPDSLTAVADYFSDIPLGLLETNRTATQLYALSGQNTLILYDTRTPNAPIERQRITIPDMGDYGSVRLMQVMGDNLYLLTESPNQIYIYSGSGNVLTLQARFAFDIQPNAENDTGKRDEESPPSLFPRRGWAMYLEGSTLVITIYFGGASLQNILLYDVADITQPRLAGTVPSLGGFAIPANGHLYIFNRPVGSTYLDIWDIRNPSAPQLVSSVPNVNGLPIGRNGNRIIIQQPADFGDWYWYDVSNPTSFQLVATHQPPLLPLIETIQWRADSSFYYVRESSYSSGIKVSLHRATLSAGSTLNTVMLYKPGGVVRNVVVANRYLYTWGDYDGVMIYDLQNPVAPRFAGRQLIPEFPNRAAVGFGTSLAQYGNRLYVNRGADMAILNTDNPLDPFLTATFTFAAPNQFEIVEANGEYVYAWDREGEQLLTVRLSDYHAVITDIGCGAMGIEDDLMVVTCGTASENSYSLQVWDLTNPLAPQQRGVLNRSTPFGTIIEVNPPYAYIMGGATIEIFDMSNRDLPIHTYTVPPNSGQQSCLYLAPIGNGHYLRQCTDTTQDDIVNLSNPNGPRLTATFGFTQTYLPPAVIGDKVFFVEGNTFQTWQIHSPFIYLPYVNRHNLPFIQGR